MLGDRHLELLTAFVDGELTGRQRKAVLHLLHRSSEARSVLQDMQENAHRLRELPQRALGKSFKAQVLEAIAERGLQPAPERPASRRRLYWTGYAAAAGLLLALGMGVYLVSHGPRQGNTESVASAPQAAKSASPSVPPLQVSFKELARKPVRETVSKRLQNEGWVHLDLKVSDNIRAVETVRTSLERRGIKTIVDPRVQVSLAKGMAATEYLIYAENIRIDDLEAILWQLTEESDHSSPSHGTFASLSVASLSGEDREKLANVFGVKVSDFAGPAKPDESLRFERAIVEGPKETGPAAPPILAAPPDRYAMVLTGSPGHGEASSEMTRFLASRRQHRPGTVQVLLVIRLA